MTHRHPAIAVAFATLVVTAKDAIKLRNRMEELREAMAAEQKRVASSFGRSTASSRRTARGRSSITSGPQPANRRTSRI